MLRLGLVLQGCKNGLTTEQPEMVGSFLLVENESMMLAAKLMDIFIQVKIGLSCSKAPVQVEKQMDVVSVDVGNQFL